MLPFLLLAAGLAALAAGLAILRTLGPGYRIGRLLVTTPRVSIADAARLARRGERRYVAVEGRIDSEQEFEDAAHRPLVLRRTRLAARLGRRWTRFEDSLEVVPFDVREGVDGMAIDTTALGEGLVVMSRVSRGHVRDLEGRLPSSLPPDAPAVVTIDQVSSVEHARVLGWPRLADDGRPFMTAGDRRPLVLSTLESGDAMRVLAGGERLRPRVAAIVFALGAVLLLGGLLIGGLTALGLVGVGGAPIVLAAGPSPALAADPTPAPTGLGGDTRSSGEGPGLVGAPAVAILGVVLLGLVAAGATLLYVRATGGPGAG